MVKSLFNCEKNRKACEVIKKKEIEREREKKKELPILGSFR